jgi:hypothetical protein
VKASTGSPFAVEVLTRSPISKGYRPRAIKIESGFPKASIGVGELFAVRFHNHSSGAVAITASIDGIDQFTFSSDRDLKTNRPVLKHWIVAAHSSHLIEGWHRDSDNETEKFLPFQTSQYGDRDSALSQSVDMAKQGILSIAIAETFSGGIKSSAQPSSQRRDMESNLNVDAPSEFISISFNRE